MAPKKMGPFCFLLRELQNERRERKFACTLETVRAEAGERWKSLTEKEKAHYEFMANRYKKKQVGSLENSFTSDGRSIAHAYQLPSAEAPTRGSHQMAEKVTKSSWMPIGHSSASRLRWWMPMRHFPSVRCTVKQSGEDTHGILITGFELASPDCRAVV
ncbi:hypothetical protein MRX96_015093 [Rhipicephalus microplus]